MQRFSNCWRVRNLLVMMLRLNQLAYSIMSLHTRLLRPSTNFRPFLQCILHSSHVINNAKEDPFPLRLISNAERSSPQTAGDLNTSNYTILNTFKLHSRKIYLLAERPNTLNLLSVLNSTLKKIQSKTWMRFPTSNTLKTSQTCSLTHRHRSRTRKYTPALALRCSITMLSHGNTTLSVALRGTYRSIPTTRLRLVKSTNISSVGSRRRV